MKWELGFLAATVAGAAAYWITQDPLAVDLTEPATRTAAFTQADFAAFDRNFPLNGDTCSVGIAAQAYCFTPSPLESRIQRGAVLDASIPVLSARYRVLARLDPKVTALKVAQFGETLALIDSDTRMVEDVLILSASGFAGARGTTLTASAGNSDAALAK